MIVRGYLKCGECGHPHILRIGMGQETEQRHHFACRSCHEAIEVGLDVDYKKVSAAFFFGKNAVMVPPLQGATVVNLDANFLIPDADQGKELVFPRLFQGASIVQKMMADRRAQGLPEVPENGGSSGRRPDFSAEWTDLKAAWSLWRNGKSELSDKRLKKASTMFYSGDALSDLADWVWRFAFILVDSRYKALFEATMKQVNLAIKSNDFDRFKAEFNDRISSQHGVFFLNY